MEPIFSMTTLQRNPSAVKESAQDGLVRITEQGGGSYIFCSEAAFEERIRKEREDAAYEARLLESVGRGVADIRDGRYATSLDDAIAEAEKLRAAYA